MSEGVDDDLTDLVLTCREDIDDPNIGSYLETLQLQLQRIASTDQLPRVEKVEPWNSIRVTLKLTSEAAVQLRRLAEQGDAALQDIGILSLRVRDGNIIFLSNSGSENDSSEQQANSGVDGAASRSAAPAESMSRPGVNNEWSAAVRTPGSDGSRADITGSRQLGVPMGWEPKSGQMNSFSGLNFSGVRRTSIEAHQEYGSSMWQGLGNCKSEVEQKSPLTKPWSMNSMHSDHPMFGKQYQMNQQYGLSGSNNSLTAGSVTTMDEIIQPKKRKRKAKSKTNVMDNSLEQNIMDDTDNYLKNCGYKSSNHERFNVSLGCQNSVNSIESNRKINTNESIINRMPSSLEPGRFCTNMTMPSHSEAASLENLLRPPPNPLIAVQNEILAKERAQLLHAACSSSTLSGQPQLTNSSSLHDNYPFTSASNMSLPVNNAYFSGGDLAGPKSMHNPSTNVTNRAIESSAQTSGTSCTSTPLFSSNKTVEHALNLLFDDEEDEAMLKQDFEILLANSKKLSTSQSVNSNSKPKAKRSNKKAMSLDNDRMSIGPASSLTAESLVAKRAKLAEELESVIASSTAFHIRDGVKEVMLNSERMSAMGLANLPLSQMMQRNVTNLPCNERRNSDYGAASKILHHSHSVPATGVPFSLSRSNSLLGDDSEDLNNLDFPDDLEDIHSSDLLAFDDDHVVDNSLPALHGSIGASSSCSLSDNLWRNDKKQIVQKKPTRTRRTKKEVLPVVSRSFSLSSAQDQMNSLVSSYANRNDSSFTARVAPVVEHESTCTSEVVPQLHVSADATDVKSERSGDHVTTSPQDPLYSWLGSDSDLCGTDSGVASNTSLSVGSDMSESDRMSASELGASSESYSLAAATSSQGASHDNAQSTLITSDSSPTTDRFNDKLTSGEDGNESLCTVNTSLSDSLPITSKGEYDSRNSSLNSFTNDTTATNIPFNEIKQTMSRTSKQDELVTYKNNYNKVSNCKPNSVLLESLSSDDIRRSCLKSEIKKDLIDKRKSVRPLNSLDRHNAISVSESAVNVPFVEKKLDFTKNKLKQHFHNKLNGDKELSKVNVSGPQNHLSVEKQSLGLSPKTVIRLTKTGACEMSNAADEWCVQSVAKTNDTSKPTAISRESKSDSEKLPIKLTLNKKLSRLGNTNRYDLTNLIGSQKIHSKSDIKDLKQISKTVNMKKVAPSVVLNCGSATKKNEVVDNLGTNKSDNESLSSMPAKSRPAEVNSVLTHTSSLIKKKPHLQEDIALIPESADVDSSVKLTTDCRYKEGITDIASKSDSVVACVSSNDSLKDGQDLEKSSSSEKTLRLAESCCDDSEIQDIGKEDRCVVEPYKDILEPNSSDVRAEPMSAAVHR